MMLKTLLIVLLLLTTTAFSMDKRLYNYPDAKALYLEATNDKSQDAAFDLARFYQTKVIDDEKAIYWYEKSYEFGSSSAALNLGNLYFKSKKYVFAKEWYKKSHKRGDTKGAYNLGYLYDEILKDTPKAIEWYQEASRIGHLKGTLNLAILYKDQKDYPKAIEWYKKAYDMGNMGGANGLGYLYDVNLKNLDEGIKWYKKGAKGGHPEATNNLGRTYHELKDDVTASAYILAMVNYGYTKQEVLDFLKNDWKIDRATLEKAYELQLKLDIPKHYKGGIN